MNVNTEDITVAWGQASDPLDHVYGKWRLAVFQDVQESLDATKLYYLYDPTSDENCITTGGRKGGSSLVVFDTHRKCFVAEILLRVQGRVKFLFALPTPSFSGGTTFVLVSQSEDYGTFSLHFWSVHTNGDGLSLAQEPAPLLNAPLSYDGEFICCLRKDIPEVVFISGPGLRVSRINAVANAPQDPVITFTVPQADLNHFYDGFLSKGNVYFVSASPDGTLDYTRVHVLSLQTHQLSTHYCHPDPQRGTPPPRREAGLDSIAGFIILAGGELQYENGEVLRLVDYWVLDLTTFTWNQIAAQMTVPLIEPRVTAGNGGNIYIWGDFDEPLPGMPPTGTHLRILRVTGLNTLNPPSYDQAINYNQPPLPYSEPGTNHIPAPNDGGNSGFTRVHPCPGEYSLPHPDTYPTQQGSSSLGFNSPNPGYSVDGPPSSSNDIQRNPQYPVYPPQKKKDCTIS